MGIDRKYINELINTQNEIQNFALTKAKISEMHGVSFDPDEFIERVEYTRLTTHFNLVQAFEYEKSKLK